MGRIADQKNRGKSVRIQAFADDYMLDLRAMTAEGLFELASKTIIDFNDWINKHNLNLNWEKTQELFPSRTHTPILPTDGSYKIDGIMINYRDLDGKEHIR